MATSGPECARQIEELVAGIEKIPDPLSREAARQLIESILELHGAGLDRMMEIASGNGNAGQALIRRFAGDSLVAALLILHDLHPDALETRVQHALGKWHGSAEMVSEFEGVVRIRLSAGGCGMKEAIEAALREAAPDAVEVIVEETFQPAGFVPLSALGMMTLGAD
jgi:hypothetical protein